MKSKTFKGRTTPEEVRKLAEEITRALDDPDNLSSYLGLCLQHPPELIRKALRETLCSDRSRWQGKQRHFFAYLVKKRACRLEKGKQDTL